MRYKKVLVKMMDAVMLNCDQASLLISKQLDGKISWIDKIRLKLHLLNCEFCNRFNLQSKKIDEILKISPDDLSHKCIHSHKIDQKSKKKIIKEINKLSDNQ